MSFTRTKKTLFAITFPAIKRREVGVSFSPVTAGPHNCIETRPCCPGLFDSKHSRSHGFIIFYRAYKSASNLPLIPSADTDLASSMKSVKTLGEYLGTQKAPAFSLPYLPAIADLMLHVPYSPLQPACLEGNTTGRNAEEVATYLLVAARSGISPASSLGPQEKWGGGVEDGRP